MTNTESKCFIYCLIDPRDETIFYVGQSSRGADEPEQYIRYGHLTTRRLVCRELFRIKRLGLQASWEVLEECSITELSIIEVFWISNLRASGARLMNMTNGGEGHHGYSPSKETREKIRQSNKQTKGTTEYRALASKNSKKMFEDKSFLEAHKIRITAAMNAPGMHEKLSIARTESNNRPDALLANKEQADRRWARDGERERFSINLRENIWPKRYLKKLSKTFDRDYWMKLLLD